MKITGLEYKRWFETRFPEGFRIEHATLETRRDDEWLIGDADVLDTNRLGGLVWDGDPEMDPTGGRGMTLTKAIREARAGEPERVLLVEVPAGRKEEFALLVKKHGGRIITL